MKPLRDLLYITILGLIANNIGYANQLMSIKNHIQETQQLIFNKKNQRDVLNQSLAQQDKQIAQLKTNEAFNHNQQRKTQSAIKKLEKEQYQLKDQLQDQQKNLGKLLAQSYILQRQPMLKRLLNHAKDSRAQLMIYFNYISKQQIEQIQKLNITLDQLKLTQTQLNTQQKQQQALSQQQQQQRLKIQRLQQSRRRTIIALNDQIKSKKAKLKALISDQKRLEKTLSQIKKQTNKTSNTKSISKKGWLWPTNGKIIQKFGTKIGESKLKWKGILIQSPAGQAVQAALSGQVVFARWLSGYGQLIIINHGNGYISLYGRNQRLNVQVNDQIKRGQTIAWVGSSGGFQKSALYFAIRYNGRAIDPKKWYAKQSSGSHKQPG